MFDRIQVRHVVGLLLPLGILTAIGWLLWTRSPDASPTTSTGTAATTIPDAVKPDAEEFLQVRALQGKVSGGEPLSDAEVEQLVAFSRHANALIQARAISGLSLLKPEPQRKQAIEALCALLSAENTLVVSYAASGLSTLDARGKAPLLVPLLKHTSADVQQAAKKSLAELGHAAP